MWRQQPSHCFDVKKIQTWTWTSSQRSYDRANNGNGNISVRCSPNWRSPHKTARSQNVHAHASKALLGFTTKTVNATKWKAKHLDDQSTGQKCVASRTRNHGVLEAVSRQSIIKFKVRRGSWRAHSTWASSTGSIPHSVDVARVNPH